MLCVSFSTDSVSWARRVFPGRVLAVACDPGPSGASVGVSLLQAPPCHSSPHPEGVSRGVGGGGAAAAESEAGTEARGRCRAHSGASPGGDFPKQTLSLSDFF